MKENTTKNGLRWQVVAVTALAAFVALGLAAGTAAGQVVNECSTLNVDGTTYELTQDVSSNETCITIDADDVTFDGMGYNVTVGEEPDQFATGIFSEGQENVEIRNVTVRGWFSGVELRDAENPVVEDITVTSAAGEGTIGISLTDSDGIPPLSTGNSGTTGAQIVNNTLSDNSIGMLISESHDNTFEDNTVVENSAQGMGFINSSDNSVIGNTVTGNGAEGIGFINTSGNTVEGNTADENRIGIGLENADGNTVEGNTANNNTMSGIGLTSRDSVQDEVLSAEDNEIVGNEANDNTWGIVILGAEDTQIVDNQANRNGLTDEENGELEPRLLEGEDGDLTQHVDSDDLATIASIIEAYPGIGIKVAGSDETTVEDNEANENLFTGISVFESGDAHVLDNDVHGNGDEEMTGVPGSGVGVFDIGILPSSAPNIIEDNTATDNTAGITLLGASEDTVRGNTANENEVGIWLAPIFGAQPVVMQSDGIPTTTGNYVVDNDAHDNEEIGILLGIPEGLVSPEGVVADGINTEDVSANPVEEEPLEEVPFVVRENTLEENRATGNVLGIGLIYTSLNEFSENTAENNDVGILSFYSFGNTFEDDTSRNNDGEGVGILEEEVGINVDYLDIVPEEPPEGLTEEDINEVNSLNIGDSEKPDTEVSFQTVNWLIGGTSQEPAPNPDAEATGRYFEAFPVEILFGGLGGIEPQIEEEEPINDEPENGIPLILLDIDLHYENADISGLDESSLRLWAFDAFEEGWSELVGLDEEGAEDSVVNPDENTVSWRYSIDQAVLAADVGIAQDGDGVSVQQDEFNIQFGAFGDEACIDRRNLARGQEDEECPFDRDLRRGETRDELDERSGRSGRGEHRDSASERRSRSR